VAVVTSEFNGTENPLSEGGVWTSGFGSVDPFGAMQKVAGSARSASAPSQGAARYDTLADGGVDIGPDQYAQAEIQSLAAGVDCGVTVHMHLASGIPKGYLFVAAGADSFQLYRIVGGSGIEFLIQYTPAPANGDVIRIEVRGPVLSPFVNGAAKTPFVDGTYISGQPGIWALGADDTADLLANWEAGDLDTPQPIILVGAV